MHCTFCGNQARSAHARICSRCGRLLQPASLQPGTLVGGAYTIIRPLGQGGQGAIYLAEDQRAFNRQCVIKELLPYADPSDAREVAETYARFEAEARMLIRLRHPNTPQVYAYMREDERLYIAMEYIQGSDLEQGLTRTLESGHVLVGKPRPLEQTLREGIEIVKILEYLAAQQPPVVHHDIKPANLIRDDDSQAIFLVDFGSVAREASQAGSRASLYGTPGYAAPEFYRGESHPKGDAYALAATLYHLLTDDDPRDHPGTFPKLDQLPAPVAQALRLALETELAARCDATSLRVALERCLQGSQAGASPIIFPDSSRPSQPEELARAAFQWWGFALSLLDDGRMVSFLRAHRMGELASWTEQCLQSPANSADVLLDTLLRKIVHDLPAPQVVAGAEELHLGVISAGTSITQPLVLTNNGGLAEVIVVPQRPWFQAHPTQLKLRPGEQASVNLAIAAEYAPTGAISGPVQLQIYNATGGLVATRRVNLSANVSTSRRSPRQANSVLWLMIIMTATFVLLTILWTLRPPGWQIYSLIVLGGAIGGVVSWMQASQIDMVFMQTVLGGLGALAGGLIIPLVITRGAALTMSPVRLIGALIGALLVPLLLSFFLDS